MICGWACTGCGWPGELTEIRAAGLRFSRAEARALFEAAGIAAVGRALARLHDRTEGWAAGLRLAALSLAGHPEPDRFAAEFSGSERTVAEYLLAEVLERQPEPARRLLLRTSVLDRVNGELADLLTGGSGGERVLQELEAGQRVRRRAGCAAVLVPLPPAVRRALAAGAAAAPSRPSCPRCTAAAGQWYAAHGLRAGGGPARDCRAGLGPGGPPALGRLARPRAQGAGQPPRTSSWPRSRPA